MGWIIELIYNIFNIVKYYSIDLHRGTFHKRVQTVVINSMSRLGDRDVAC